MTVDLPAKPYFSIREISAMSGVSEPALYLMARDGRIRSIRFGILVRVPREEVIRLLEEGTRKIQTGTASTPSPTGAVVETAGER